MELRVSSFSIGDINVYRGGKKKEIKRYKFVVLCFKQKYSKTYTKPT